MGNFNKGINGAPSFEELLKKDERVKSTPFQKIANTSILKSDKGCTLEDFIAMVAKFSSKALKKHNAVFIPDEGGIIKDPHNTLENPTILYKVIDRIPVKELKPRPMEQVTEDNDDDTNRRHGIIYGYKQKCTVQFDIVACDYKTANSVMTTFEEMMFTYTGYFKSKGVAEIYFTKHFTDKNLDNYRQDLSVRSLQYYVEIQKLITVFDTTIDNIDL